MGNVNCPNERPCSGCGVCAAICPKQAIRMESDDMGFYRAVVQEDRCVDCGLCTQICPRFAAMPAGAELEHSKLYALQSTEPGTVFGCSSGGVAHELARWILENGGIAAGAVYDLKSNTVRHKIVTRPEMLSELDGSKYLQSQTEEAFRTVLHGRGEEKCVVFGTPCQITALAMAAEKLGIRQRLLLVEIFCHGVPSYRVWEESLKTIRKKLGTESFDAVRFRYKKDDWHSYCLRVDGGGRTWYGRRETALFWQVFFENMLLGDACRTCTARKAQSHADLRLGDYWGRQFRDRRDGVSGVFACTERGREAIEDLLSAGRLQSMGQTDAAGMLANQNMAGYGDNRLHGETMEVLRTRGVRKAVAYYRKRQPPKVKLKRWALTASAVIPDPIRAKLRKKNPLHKG